MEREITLRRLARGEILGFLPLLAAVVPLVATAIGGVLQHKGKKAQQKAQKQATTDAFALEREKQKTAAIASGIPIDAKGNVISPNAAVPSSATNYTPWLIGGAAVLGVMLLSRRK